MVNSVTYSSSRVQFLTAAEKERVENKVKKFLDDMGNILDPLLQSTPKQLVLQSTPKQLAEQSKKLAEKIRQLDLQCSELDELFKNDPELKERLENNLEIAERYKKFCEKLCQLDLRYGLNVVQNSQDPIVLDTWKRVSGLENKHRSLILTAKIAASTLLALGLSYAAYQYGGQLTSAAYSLACKIPYLGQKLTCPS